MSGLKPIPLASNASFFEIPPDEQSCEAREAAKPGSNLLLAKALCSSFESEPAPVSAEAPVEPASAPVVEPSYGSPENYYRDGVCLIPDAVDRSLSPENPWVVPAPPQAPSPSAPPAPSEPVRSPIPARPASAPRPRYVVDEDVKLNQEVFIRLGLDVGPPGVDGESVDGKAGPCYRRCLLAFAKAHPELELKLPPQMSHLEVRETIENHLAATRAEILKANPDKSEDELLAMVTDSEREALGTSAVAPETRVAEAEVEPAPEPEVVAEAAPKEAPEEAAEAAPAAEKPDDAYARGYFARGSGTSGGYGWTPPAAPKLG